MLQSLFPWIRKGAVGSTNSVKAAALRAVIGRVVPHATVHTDAVASGVPDQLGRDEETQRGADERARQVLVLKESAEFSRSERPRFRLRPRLHPTVDISTSVARRLVTPGRPRFPAACAPIRNDCALPTQ